MPTRTVQHPELECSALHRSYLTPIQHSTVERHHTQLHTRFWYLSTTLLNQFKSMYLSDTRAVHRGDDLLFQVHMCTKWTSVLRMSLFLSVSTVQYTTVQYTIVNYSILKYTTVQYNTIQYATLQYTAVQYSTLQCRRDKKTQIILKKFQVLNSEIKQIDSWIRNTTEIEDAAKQEGYHTYEKKEKERHEKGRKYIIERKKNNYRPRNDVRLWQLGVGS